MTMKGKECSGGVCCDLMEDPTGIGAVIDFCWVGGRCDLICDAVIVSSASKSESMSLTMDEERENDVFTYGDDGCCWGHRRFCVERLGLLRPCLHHCSVRRCCCGSVLHCCCC